MKKLFAIATLITSMLLMVSCSEDDGTANLDSPELTAPAASSVQVGTDITLDFTYTADAGFASSSVAATGGTTVVTTDGTADATSGTITVTFSATTAGAGSVVLTITDGEGDTGDATAVITVSESDVPEITGIPATGTVEAEVAITTITATIAMEDVPGTLNITKNGEAFGSAIAITTDGQTVDFDYTPSIEEANTNVTFAFTAADSDDDEVSVTYVLEVTAPDFETVVVSSNIDADATWETGKVYELAGRITVLSGVTLTIQKGVIIKGQPGAESNAKALLVARGAMLNAIGTADEPIIFTSTQDEIIPGQISSPNLTADMKGLWGGLLILGDAPISTTNTGGADVSEVQIEGIPASDTNGLYGGSDETDNSGTIQYVSIRHGGTDIGAGNEINGLTLGGVGSGTTIDHIEVVANNDDGIEWFGGSVNVSHVIVWKADDDAIDTDQDWTGTLSNFIVVSPGDKCFELDGPEGSAATVSGNNNTLTNGTVYVGDDSGGLIDFDDNTNVDMSNIYFFGLKDGTQVVDGYSAAFQALGSVATLEITVPTGVTAADVMGGIESTKYSTVDANANTVGPDGTEFQWTFAYRSGALKDIGLD